MSLLFIDGFDHYPSIRRKYQVASGLENPDYVAGRFGGLALRKQFQNGAGTNTRSFGQQGDVTFGIAFFPPSFPGLTESMWRLVDAGGLIRCTISITSTGILSITAGNRTEVSATALPTSQWSFIEVHYIPKDAAGKGGVAELRVDEFVVASIDGALFSTTTGADDDVAGFQLLDDGTNSPRYLLDDLYILNSAGTTNNAYLGDVRVTTMAAKADGTLNDWTASEAGANFEMVDEVSLNSTDFVESGLVGASEDYDNDSFADRVITPGIIFGVQVANATIRTDAGTIIHQNEMVIGGVRFTDGISITAGAGDFFIDTYVEDTDPSDGATWTESKVAAVGSGITITFKET